MELKNPRRLDRVIWIRSVSYRTCSYISMFVNSFVNIVVSQLYFDMIFRNNFLSNIKYIQLQGQPPPPIEKFWLCTRIWYPAEIHTLNLDGIFGPAVANTHPAVAVISFRVGAARGQENPPPASFAEVESVLSLTVRSHFGLHDVLD
jgi:hypothetical protein